MMVIPLRVLMLEDRPEDAELAAYQLRRADFAPQCQRVETLADFLAGLESGPDVILSDFAMPQLDAMQALGHFRERRLEIPFILVSGTIGEERAVAAMREGATDYVPKDHLERLGPVVIRALEESRLRRLSRANGEQLKLQAAALAAAANGIVITDREGNIVWANAAVLAMSGYSLEELRGQNPRLFSSGKQDDAFYRDLWDTIRAGKIWKGELTNRRKNGSLYEEEMTITPVQDDRGQVSHFIAIKQDVSQGKQLQAQLLQAQKMEAVGRLAGGVAHDFNNLLTVICGFSELLLAGLPPGDGDRELVSQIKQAGERAAGLTRQLLAFSRKQVLQPQVLNLNDAVAELKKMLGRLLGEDVVLTTAPGANLYPVRADPGQIQQVLINLAINARDAMPQGGQLAIATSNVTLNEAFIRNHPKAHAGPYVLLEVADTGCGMTPEVLAHLFEPFFTTKEVGKGTGLGLATVQGIIGQSGGHIDVDSHPGRGTVFRIYLPRADAPGECPPLRPSAAGIHRGGETILLVEDDDGVRTLAGMILHSAGYTVLEARNGEEGLEVFKRHPDSVHLLLTDVVMPHMDGCQLAERLASRSPELRVICMSGYLDDALVRHGIQEKGLPFLHKPFGSAVLLEKVRDVLDAPVSQEILVEAEGP